MTIKEMMERLEVLANEYGEDAVLHIQDEGGMPWEVESVYMNTSAGVNCICID